jgi:hypothetical protein
MGAELLEPVPVFSMRPQAIQIEVAALQFDLRSACDVASASRVTASE